VLRDHPGNIEARLRLAREHMELGDAVSAGRLIEEGESAGVCSFELARLGLEVATRRSDLAMALSQLRKMLLALPPGNPLMEKQLRELEAKYAGRLAAGVERTL
jgi:hypothetical protein